MGVGGAHRRMAPSTPSPTTTATPAKMVLPARSNHRPCSHVPPAPIAVLARHPRRHWGYLDGGRSYTLTVPRRLPAKLFWSITVYDAQTQRIATSRTRPCGPCSSSPASTPPTHRSALPAHRPLGGCRLALDPDHPRSRVVCVLPHLRADLTRLRRQLATPGLPATCPSQTFTPNSSAQFLQINWSVPARHARGFGPVGMFPIPA